MGQVARANLLQNRQNGGVCPGAVLINLEDMLIAHSKPLHIVLRQPRRQ